MDQELDRDHARDLDRDRQMNVQRCRERAGAGRHDQRIEHDLPQHDAERLQKRRMIAIAELDEEQHRREQENAVTAEDQRGWRGSFRAQHGERKPRPPHIADIAVSTGETRQRGFAQRQTARKMSNRHRRNKRGAGPERRCNQKRWWVVELRKRCFRHDDEQQGRQRHVEQEEVHPSEAGFRQLLRLAAGEADENQAEIRHRKIENIDHFKERFGRLLWALTSGG